MKTLQTKLDIEDILPEDRSEDEVFLDIVMFTITQAHPDGLDFKNQRSLFRIITEIEKKQDKVNIEDSDYEFLRRCAESVKTFPINNARVVNKFLDILGV